MKDLIDCEIESEFEQITKIISPSREKDRIKTPGNTTEYSGKSLPLHWGLLQGLQSAYTWINFGLASFVLQDFIL